MISLLRLLYKAETIKKSNLTFNGILEGMGTASAGWRHPLLQEFFVKHSMHLIFQPCYGNLIG